MDRRTFLQSGSLAAAAGAAIANGFVSMAAAETRRLDGTYRAAAHDWSHRVPKGSPVIKRFDEQRWVLDNVIQANGVDWDQSHTGVAIRAGGPSSRTCHNA